MGSFVFSRGEASDPAYRNLRDSVDPTFTKCRDFVEKLWAQFEPFADDNFLIEIRSNFAARFWEMYLTCALLEHAPAGRFQVSCPKPGPDILLTTETGRIWIEAVTASNGMAGRPDTVVDPSPDGRIPEEKLVLRYMAAVCEKDAKYRQYLKSGIIAPQDVFVIAVNGSTLSYCWTQAEGDAPRFLKALYPIGPFQVHLDRRTNEIVGTGNAARFSIKKATGAAIPTSGFLDGELDGISAVLCSHASEFSHEAPLGSGFEVGYNPTSRNPLPTGLLPGRREWIASLDEAGGTLEGRMT